MDGLTVSLKAVTVMRKKLSINCCSLSREHKEAIDYEDSFVHKTVTVRPNLRDRP